MIRACLFDLDGTLLDTLEGIRYFVNITARAYGLSEIGTDETKMLVGGGAKDLIKKLLRKSGIEVNTPENEKLYLQILGEYLESYDADPAYLTEPYEGIVELLSFLKARGVRLAIISNKPKSTVKLLAERFFPGVFDRVEGAREDYPLKPDPTLALDIAKELGAEPSEVAYFGDTGTDMKTGRAMGAAITFGVLWGFRDKAELEANGADITVARAEEIKAFI